MDIPNREIVEKLLSLQKKVDASKKSATEKRIHKNPFVTDLEYLLGSFIEMYEPQVHKTVMLLSKKGYLIDASSGFFGKSAEMQALNGYIHPDFMTRNKLENIGIKFREYQGLVSYVFYPDSANLEKIEKKFLQIAQILPDKGPLAISSQQNHAVSFRMKFIPKDKKLQKKRLFERLLQSVQQQIENDFENRKAKKKNPDKTELCLGAFIEELEVQARAAVVTLVKKGYSIDTSGFMDNPCQQMLEGDFQIDGAVIKKLQSIGAVVETNASGYTRIQFSPQQADISHISNQWMQIATLLPKRQSAAEPSMTKKAREFRAYYTG